MRRLTACIALLVLSLPLAAKDEIYRWVDAEGVVHYGSKPPQKDAKPAELPPLQTYKAGSAPPSATSGPAAATPPPASRAVTDFTLQIGAPVDGETFRDPQGIVPVSVMVSPALPDGVAYVFYLDGVAQNRLPWAAGSYTFTEVERGEHSISVAAVAKDGAELKRSAPVRIFQMPPIAPPPAPKKGG